MDVYKELHDRYTYLYFKIKDIKDEECRIKVEVIMAKHQEIWDDGFSNLPTNNPIEFFYNTPKRKPENEEREIIILMKWVSDALWDIIIEAWLKQFARDQMVSALNVIGELDYDSKISFEKTHSISLKQIVKIWNKTHSESEVIYALPEFES